MHMWERPVELAGAERHGVARPARRGFLWVSAAAALSFLSLAREAAAQACCDQYGRPVTAPGTVVAPVAPAYVPAGAAVSGTRQVARRTARRTGRRDDVREDIFD